MIHIWDYDIDLTKRVVHISAGVLRGRNDGDLAGGRHRAAHAVDLLDVGRTHDLEENVVPEGLVLGQILLVEDDGFARTASHIDARVFFHIFHAVSMPPYRP
jgi:hypothetical protein